MYSVYILQSLKDLRTYVGYSKNFQARLKQHNEGKVKSTQRRRPLILLFKEEFDTIGEAKQKELWWKTKTGRQKMKKFFINK